MKKNSYHITAIGCQMNKADSERIAGFLNSQGLHSAENRETAEFIILTTCGIRQSAEDRLYGLAHRIRKNQPKAKIIITGCLSERKDVYDRLKGKADLFLPIGKILILKKWIKRFGQSNARKKTEIILSDRAPDNCYLNIKPAYESNFQAFIPIGNGCDNFCSYCVVPYARGRETYRPASEIFSEAAGLIKSGYKEITLIAQNVNSYRDNKSQILPLRQGSEGRAISNPPAGRAGFQNYDLKDKSSQGTINFPELLLMINAIPGDFWIRFATSHPKDMSDELISTIARCKKVCRHIHLPAQSGDDKILKKMNRKYTAGHYAKLISKIRKTLNKTDKNILSNLSSETDNNNSWQPPVSVSTDIITGFPGETRAQFNNTKKLFKASNFDMAYISQYSPRPGTASAKIADSVPKAEKKKREEELMEILRKTALANNRKYKGKTVRVLAEGKNKKGEWYGKTETYKVVKFPALSVDDLTGKFIQIKIIKAEDFGLKGIIAEQRKTKK
ncbi:MAG: MiaB/RimO family radical SAM methylthiotransferase [Patescibacteria group bacterium]|jgi:tRNA-2-methylthio-N6-dimethylallyladenosine synthase